MSKVISLTTLHYGSDFLEWGLRSIYPSVEEMWVLYTPQGSFGHHTTMPCPDTRENLFALAKRGAGDKLRWYENTYTGEGQHRDMIYQLAPDADIILVVDADEIWEAGLAEEVVSFLEVHNAKSLKIHVSHAWRSFHRWILNDGMHGEHAHAPKHTGDYRVSFNSNKRIWHFGYAQNEAVTRYKIETHGHRPEWRPDWWEHRFLANIQEDVHPVVFNAWNPEPVDPYALGFPAWMIDHPYAKLEVIK